MNGKFVALTLMTLLGVASPSTLQASACGGPQQRNRVQGQQDQFRYAKLTQFINREDPGYNFALDTAEANIPSGTYRLWVSDSQNGPFEEVVNFQYINSHKLENGESHFFPKLHLRLQKVQ